MRSMQLTHVFAFAAIISGSVRLLDIHPSLAPTRLPVHAQMVGGIILVSAALAAVIKFRAIQQLLYEVQVTLGVPVFDPGVCDGNIYSLLLTKCYIWSTEVCHARPSLCLSLMHLPLQHPPHLSHYLTGPNLNRSQLSGRESSASVPSPTTKRSHYDAASQSRSRVTTQEPFATKYIIRETFQ